MGQYRLRLGPPPSKTRGRLRRGTAAFLRWLDGKFGSDFADGLPLAIWLAPRIASGAARARVILAGAVFASRRWHRPIRLRLDAADRAIDFVLPDYSAFKVLGEVFVQNEYDIALDGSPKTILDLGANVGASVLYFRRRFPSARIVAIEAGPGLVPILRHNTRELDAEVRHAAVTERAGMAYFQEATESWEGTTTIADGSPGVETVPSVTLDSLLSDPVDLVKVDIEGAEFDVLPSCERLDRVSAMVGEIHSRPETSRSIDLLKRLDGFEVETNDPTPRDRFTIFRARRPRG
jgi:FkbM family methyltransferase